jgi:hypothetical protein
MTGVDILLLVLGVLGTVVMIIRYNSGDPFAYCGRRVYAED